MILYETSRQGILLQVLSDNNEDWWHQPRRTKYTLRLVINGFEQQYFLREINDHRNYNTMIPAINRMIDWAGQPNVIRELVNNVHEANHGIETFIPEPPEVPASQTLTARELSEAVRVLGERSATTDVDLRSRWLNEAMGQWTHERNESVDEQGYLSGL
jgi:hypothetical protein